MPMKPIVPNGLVEELTNEMASTSFSVKGLPSCKKSKVSDSSRGSPAGAAVCRVLKQLVESNSALRKDPRKHAYNLLRSGILKPLSVILRNLLDDFSGLAGEMRP